MKNIHFKIMDVFYFRIKMHMKRNVYYGEYTLMYWIDMMLSGKIRLPEYQRFLSGVNHKYKNL